MHGSETGGPGAGPLPALFSDAKADYQKKQPEGQGGGHERGMDEGGQSAQFNFPVAGCGVILLIPIDLGGGEGSGERRKGFRLSVLSGRPAASRMPEF